MKPPTARQSRKLLLVVVVSMVLIPGVVWPSLSLSGALSGFGGVSVSECAPSPTARSNVGADESSKSLLVSPVSGVTGATFRASRGSRRAPTFAALPDTPSTLRSVSSDQTPPRAASKCNIWGAMTTVHGPPPSATSLLERGACVVVVGDANTDDAPWKAWAVANSSLIYLSLADQRSLDLHIIKHLPDNHFGKKNVAYLYAAAQGAEWIFDFDDDNNYVQDSFETALKGSITFELQPPMDNRRNYSVHNPLPLFRPVSKGKAVSRMWPRGLPLDEVKQVQVTRSVHQEVNVGIVQCLANGDPDVDAIFRLTSDTPVTFSEPNMRVLLPVNGYSPLNAQATWIHRSMAHMMLLPISVHGRVSDIWRSYILERAAHAAGQRVAFNSACVVHDRNVHSYLSDYMAERPLYEQAGEFIRVLAEIADEDLEQNPLQVLYAALYEHGLIEESDLQLAHAWMSDLARLGIKSGASKKTAPAVPPKTTTPPRNAICYFGEPRSLPRSAEKLQKNLHEVFDVEAFAEFPKTKLPMDDLAQMGPWGGLRLGADDNATKWLLSHGIDVDVLTANGTRKEDWLSGLTLLDGGAVFIWRGLNECLKMIEARETERGSKFELVIFSRTDLYFPKPVAIQALSPSQCWIPCPCNDNSGYCDQFAICGRNGADAYADVLGSLRRRMKEFKNGDDPFGPEWLVSPKGFSEDFKPVPISESYLRRRLDSAQIGRIRGHEVFARICQCDAYASSCKPHLRPPPCIYQPEHKVWYREANKCEANGHLADGMFRDSVTEATNASEAATIAISEQPSHKP